MHRLYVKTHNKTGLKYLGFTKQNPNKYLGSGKYWKYHLKKHGVDIATEIIGTYETKEELSSAGKYYSDLWDIVNSNDWANLMPEVGDGLDPSVAHKIAIDRVKNGTHNFFDKDMHERKAPFMRELMKKENAKRVSNGTHNFLGNTDNGFHTMSSEKHKEIASKGGKKTAELGLSGVNFYTTGQRQIYCSAGGKATALLKKSGMHLKKTCPYCGHVGQAASLGRWHFDNCKERVV